MRGEPLGTCGCILAELADGGTAAAPGDPPSVSLGCCGSGLCSPGMGTAPGARLAQAGTLARRRHPLQPLPSAFVPRPGAGKGVGF